MTPSEIDLAKRLVECEEWRPQAGMAFIYGDERYTVIAVQGNQYMLALVESGDDEPCYGWHFLGELRAMFLLDLHDWATVGCLLGMFHGEVERMPKDGWLLGWVRTGRLDLAWDVAYHGPTPGDEPQGSVYTRMRGAHPGPALARLLLEVSGATPPEREEKDKPGLCIECNNLVPPSYTNALGACGNSPKPSAKSNQVFNASWRCPRDPPEWEPKVDATQPEREEE